MDECDRQYPPEYAFSDTHACRCYLYRHTGCEK
jgi:hypothetical protein